MNDLLVWGYFLLASFVMILYVFAIYGNNRIIRDSIDRGDEKEDDYEKIFVPIGICGTWMMVKKK